MKGASDFLSPTRVFEARWLTTFVDCCVSFASGIVSWPMPHEVFPRREASGTCSWKMCRLKFIDSGV